MDTIKQVQHPGRSNRPFWLKTSLISLVIEKIIQHTIVSLAFFFDWNAISATVAISPRLLLLLGIIVAACFVVSLWGIVHHSVWAIPLVIALALFDIIGEFAAQGKLGIMITVSFIAAVVLLVLALMWLRNEPRVTTVAPDFHYQESGK
jgi:hypothetical protein